MTLALAVTVYLTVLLAELLGDKTLYTVGTLATTHRVAAVLGGAGVAVALKMGAAVLFGGVIARLPPLAVSIVSAGTFFGMAASLWFSREKAEDKSARPGQSWARGARVAFLGIFLTEWADFGQITAAALAAQYGRPLVVWGAASLAMITKVTCAVVLGMGIQKWVPKRVLRPITAGACLLLGVVAALRLEA
jgi:putative Ca2+/H+ antiporter (TMEM165/GDT1 family)